MDDILLGKNVPVPEQYDPKILRTVPVRVRTGAISVGLEFTDFTSVCPITGQPDFAEISIDYVPVDKYIESKSLKLYLASYRSYKSFQEDITAQIANDLCDLLGVEVVVTSRFTARGSISILARANAFPPLNRETKQCQ